MPGRYTPHWGVFIVVGLPFVFATYRYYSINAPFGSGDTIVQLWHAHGGSRSGIRKWNAECMDGEAMTGLQDFVDDYEKLQTMWCQFMFPNKPSSQGAYPYYPRCHVRDYFSQFFCFNPQNATSTINTFMTGLWDNDFNFYVFRPGTGFTGDQLQPYKCCKTPDGYYIDYVSCYYQPTHDLYFEYYDSQFQYLVKCSTGYVMTGISKKQNPYEHDWHVEWIQCCRVGYGPPAAQSPPMVTSASGMPAYAGSIQPVTVPTAYHAQYRSLEKWNHDSVPAEMPETAKYINRTRQIDTSDDTDWGLRYQRKDGPATRNKQDSDRPKQTLLGVFIPGESYNVH